MKSYINDRICDVVELETSFSFDDRTHIFRNFNSFMVQTKGTQTFSSSSNVKSKNRKRILTPTSAFTESFWQFSPKLTKMGDFIAK